MLLRGTKDLHDARQLLLLVFARKDGIPCEELGQDATQAPHIDWQSVAHAQNDLGRPVESGLDIRVNLLVLEATRTKVDHFDFRMKWVSKQDIFWFQITMDHSMALQKH